jgi:pimeloyl-ACP methyl ester carboxylesterase
MAHVALLIPGIMGSVLKLNGEIVWPGSAWELYLPYGKTDKLLDSHLIATDVIRKVSVSVQYQGLIDDLGKCGFRENDNPKSLYVCPYDWRKDNAEATTKLADLADYAVTQGGATEISLIAHSMGGLVSRYYLESGEFAGRPGLAAVRRLLTLGTPHRGWPLALSAAMGKEKRLFLSAEQVQQLVSDTRYPALYQLMPPPGEPFAWDEDKAAEFGEVDIYDAGVAKALKLVTRNLNAAKKFHKTLDINKRPTFQGKPIRYFFFAGTRQTTISSVNVLCVDAARYEVRKTELEDAGDGTVPAWSATITGVQGQPVGGEHSTLYRNGLLRRTMAVLLGAKGVLAVQPMQVEVSLRERVVHATDTVHAALTFGAGVDKLDGKLVIYLMEVDEGGAVKSSRLVSQHQISYAGLNAEKLNVIFSAPAFPGIYQVPYILANYNDPAGSDELFVQQD